MNICIYGASSARLDKAYYDAAYELGTLIGSAGHTVVFGGGKAGLMGAAARGAYESGGRVIAIVPEFFNEPGIIYEHCAEVIFTDTMRERKQRMDEYADAFAVLPGGIGTFEEFFEMLTLKQLGRHSKAMALLNTNDAYAPMLDMLEKAADEGFMSRRCMALFSVCATPEMLMDYIEGYVPVTGSVHRLEDYTK